LILLETKRVYLSVLSPGDAARASDYYLRNTNHLEPWEPARTPNFHSLDSWRKRGENAQAEFMSGASLRLVGQLKTGPAMIASCNFTNIQRGPFQACTLGYSIDENLQGQGYMFEILEAATGHVFNYLGLNRIMANHVPENARSAALLAKLGFEREGYAEAYLKIEGVWRDHILTAKRNPNPSP